MNHLHTLETALAALAHHAHNQALAANQQENTRATDYWQGQWQAYLEAHKLTLNAIKQNHHEHGKEPQ